MLHVGTPTHQAWLRVCDPMSQPERERGPTRRPNQVIPRSPPTAPHPAIRWRCTIALALATLAMSCGDDAASGTQLTGDAGSAGASGHGQVMSSAGSAGAAGSPGMTSNDEGGVSTGAQDAAVLTDGATSEPRSDAPISGPHLGPPFVAAGYG